MCYQFYRKKICNALQILLRNTRNLQYTANFLKSFVYLQRISFLAIKIECKMNSKVNK